MAEVALGDDVEGRRVVEDVVVERELAAAVKRLRCKKFHTKRSSSAISPGHKVDALALDSLPVALADIGSGSGELVGGKLASPVGLNSLFHLTVST